MLCNKKNPNVRAFKFEYFPILQWALSREDIYIV